MKFCTSCGDGPQEGLVRVRHGATIEHELCLKCGEQAVQTMPDGPDRSKLAQALIEAGRRSPLTDDVRYWLPTPRNVSKQ